MPRPSPFPAARPCATARPRVVRGADSGHWGTAQGLRRLRQHAGATVVARKRRPIPGDRRAPAVGAFDHRPALGPRAGCGTLKISDRPARIRSHGLLRAPPSRKRDRPGSARSAIRGRRTCRFRRATCRPSPRPPGCRPRGRGPRLIVGRRGLRGIAPATSGPSCGRPAPAIPGASANVALRIGSQSLDMRAIGETNGNRSRPRIGRHAGQERVTRSAGVFLLAALQRFGPRAARSSGTLRRGRRDPPRATVWRRCTGRHARRRLIGAGPAKAPRPFRKSTDRRRQHRKGKGRASLMQGQFGLAVSGRSSPGPGALPDRSTAVRTEGGGACRRFRNALAEVVERPRQGLSGRALPQPCHWIVTPHGYRNRQGADGARFQAAPDGGIARAAGGEGAPPRMPGAAPPVQSPSPSARSRAASGCHDRATRTP